MKSSKLAVALAAAALSIMSCNPKQETDGAYIGPADLRIEDGRMTPEVLLSLGRLSDPQLSPDGSKILYGVSYTSIADNRSCRNLFLCNPDGSGKVQLTRDGKSINGARWSSDGKSLFFLQGGQLWKADFLGDKLGKRTQLTDVPNGISDYKLSPDQQQVILVSTVPSNVKSPADFDPALDKAQAYVTEDLMYRHWDHWVTELPHSYVANFANGTITPDRMLDILGGPDVKFELPLGPYGGAEQLTWSPDGSKIAWLSMERDGYEADKVRLMTADLAYNEVSDGQSANPAVSGIKDLTADFKYNAAEPVWAADGKSIYFNSLVEGLQGIFNVSDAGMIRLTPEDAWYDFNSPFAVLEDGTLLASYCSMDFPNELVCVKDGKFQAITHENEHLLSQLKPHKTEARWIDTVDGQKMLTWVLFPPEFDETKTYPAIEIFLGGPQGTLSQGWSYRWNYDLMCNQGYVVVLPNRRGTTAFGQEWCEQISGDYIGLNMQDYLSAAKMIKAEPYIGKLAGCGASYGGFSTYYMAGIHGDVFDCFIAHAGIFDEKYMYYETEEMWFPNFDNGGLSTYAYTPGQTGPAGDGVTFGGLQQAGSPWSSAAKAQRHYANSPAANVTKWHTPILCIHGMMDYRIPYDQGMAAFNAAQMMGVPSKLIVFPQENHWILQPQNALFWHRSYFDWLDQWCK